MNNNFTKKPLMLTGLILNIVVFILLGIYSLIAMIAVLQVLSEISSTSTDMAAIILMAMLIFLLIFSIVGIIISSVALTRLKLSNEEFAQKKGVVLASFVFDCILAVFILIAIISKFDIVMLIALLLIICAGTLIMVDFAKKPKVSSENDKTQSTEAQTNEIAKDEINEENSDKTENN